MRNFLIRRLLSLIPLLLMVSIIVFGIISLMGDPFEQLRTNPRISSGDIARIKRLWGFDKPWYYRYFYWLRSILVGEWGLSLLSPGKNALQVVSYRLPVSIQYGTASLILELLIAIPIGIYSALHKYSVGDNIATGLVFFGLSMPTFFFGVVMLMTFSARLGWFPPGGFMTPGMEDMPFLYQVVDRARHLFLPVLVLALVSAGAMLRYVRSSFLEVINQDYIRTARAKGLSERVVINKHAMRNALIPVVTLLALSLPAIIGGATITETVFSIPGIGKLLYEGIMAHDYMVVQSVLMMFAILVVLGNLLADILYAVVDPRVKYD